MTVKVLSQLDNGKIEFKLTLSILVSILNLAAIRLVDKANFPNNRSDLKSYLTRHITRHDIVTLQILFSLVPNDFFVTTYTKFCMDFRVVEGGQHIREMCRNAEGIQMNDIEIPWNIRELI